MAMNTDDIIMPTLASKYPGSVSRTSNGSYRLDFTFTDTGVRYSSRFTTYDDAREHLQWLSEREGNTRVKNIIYREPGATTYIVELTGGHTMRFDEVDLPLVQAHVWFYDNRGGYVRCSAKSSLPSTLFHVCAMPPIDESHEFVHLNGECNDNRRCNIAARKRTRTKRKIEEV